MGLGGCLWYPRLLLRPCPSAWGQENLGEAGGLRQPQLCLPLLLFLFTFPTVAPNAGIDLG